MAQLLVRNLDDDVKLRLRARADRRGHSMEEEVRAILRAAAQEPDPVARGLGTGIAARFAGLGLDEDIAELRGQAARPAGFAG